MSLDIRTPPNTSGWLKRDIANIKDWCDKLTLKLRQKTEGYDNVITDHNTKLDTLIASVNELTETVSGLVEKVAELEAAEEVTVDE